MPEMQRARYRYRALFHQRADNPPYWAASIARFSRLALMSRRSDSPITPSPFLSRREKSASCRAMNWALVVSRDGLSWLIRSGTGLPACCITPASFARLASFSATDSTPSPFLSCRAKRWAARSMNWALVTSPISGETGNMSLAEAALPASASTKNADLTMAMTPCDGRIRMVRTRGGRATPGPAAPLCQCSPAAISHRPLFSYRKTALSWQRRRLSVKISGFCRAWFADVPPPGRHRMNSTMPVRQDPS